MKRLLGLGKTGPEKSTPQSSTSKECPPASTTKRSLKDWGSMFKHGFLSADQDEQVRETFLEAYDADDTGPEPLSPSRFPISLDPAYQARLQGDLELLIIISANRFIMREVQHGRISRHSVEKVRRYWESRNLAQVVEYQFDQSTQRALIVDNLQTVLFCGAHYRNSVATSTSLLAWGTLAREMSVRTFCTGDSVIRKWLKDVPGVLEMLGAPVMTFDLYEKMAIKAQLVINERFRAAKEQEETASSSQQTTTSRSGSPSRPAEQSAYAFRSASHNRNVSSESHLNGPFPSLDAQLEVLEAMPRDEVRAPRIADTQSRALSPQDWKVVTPRPSPSPYNDGEMQSAYAIHQPRSRPTTPFNINERARSPPPPMPPMPFSENGTYARVRQQK
jgi:hypothetical protein